MSKQQGGGIQAIHGVILIANNFEGQCRFYGDVLGLEEVVRGADMAFFRVSNQVLGVFAKSHHPEGARRLGAGDHGLSHLEFQIAPADKSRLLAKLDAAGFHAYGENFADADGTLFHFTS